MMHAQTIEKKPMTELTCWKCGEEALVEAPRAVAALNAMATVSVAADGRHSICGKCGTRSVSTAQALQNKSDNRKVRKAIIREANRKLM
jgi:hypothetical protein